MTSCQPQSMVFRGQRRTQFNDRWKISRRSCVQCSVLPRQAYLMQDQAGMSMAHWHQRSSRHAASTFVVIVMLLLSGLAVSQAAPRARHAAANTGACTGKGQVPTAIQPQDGVCDVGINQEPLKTKSSHQHGTAPRDLQQQLQAQQLLLNVLGNITAQAITADAALELLRGVASLRASLAHGAAAERWAKLKAKSARAKQLRNPVQQKESTQLQNQQAPQEEDMVAAEQSKEPLTPSRGILFVAGGQHQLMNAYVLLQLLRHPTIACLLPVEVVYYGMQEYDTTAVGLIQAHAKATGTLVTFVDGYEAAPTRLEPHKPISRLTGFKTKVHALTFVTSFDEVLMLDSDNTPLADPSYLFNSTVFGEMGNIQWLDFWRNQWMKPVLYTMLGLDVPWEVNPRFRASEAGQLMIDRVRHYDVLEWLWLLNTHSNSGVPGTDPGVVGKCIWGDKDTYPIAFHLAGKSHLINNVQHYPMQALSKPGVEYMHAGMVQRGLYGELLFLHRTAAGKLWPHCVARSMLTCRVWGLTTPVDQDQLVASVRDVTAMQFEPRRINLTWQEQHCRSDNNAGAGDLTSTHHQQQHHSETVVSCNFEQSVGLLPIPVIAAKRLPQQVQKMLDVTYDVFMQSVRQLKAAPTPAAFKQQQQQQQSSDSYYDPSDPYE